MRRRETCRSAAWRRAAPSAGWLVLPDPETPENRKARPLRIALAEWSRNAAAGFGQDEAVNDPHHGVDRVWIGALYTLSPPYHGILGCLTDVPDLGLQIYALVMLYTAPGSGWFNRRRPTPAGA